MHVRLYYVRKHSISRWGMKGKEGNTHIHAFSHHISYIHATFKHTCTTFRIRAFMYLYVKYAEYILKLGGWGRRLLHMTIFCCVYLWPGLAQAVRYLFYCWSSLTQSQTQNNTSHITIMSSSTTATSGEQFSLVWNTFPRNLSSGLYNLLAGEQLVDVTLAAEGQILRAHKLILSVCSTYFRDLFKVRRKIYVIYLFTLLLHCFTLLKLQNA